MARHLRQLPGLRVLEAWPPAGAPASLQAFQAGPVRVLALGLPADPEPWLAALTPHASEARRQRAARFHFRIDALRCLAAEALLRQGLQERWGLDLEALELRAGRTGKPRVANQPAIHFNLSHSGSWVLCALHDRPVGIDVEAVRDAEDLPAAMVMAPEELHHWGSLAAPEAQAFFFRLWTLKESLLKALGTGLSLDPRAVRLRFQGSGVAATLRDHPLPGWKLVELDMPEGVKAALCYRGG